MNYGSIPAGGEGQRMQPLGFSKELLPVCGRAVIEHLIERMLLAGIDKIFINTSSDKCDIIKYISEKSEYRDKCIFLVRPRKGLLDAVVQPEQFLRANDSLYFGLPDTVWFPKDCFNKLTEDCDISLGLFDSRTPNKFDSVYTDADGNVHSIRVKEPNPQTKWTWGIGRLSVSKIRHLNDLAQSASKKSVLMGEVMNTYAQRNPVKAVRFADSAYADIGEPQSYERIKEFIRKFELGGRAIQETE